MTHEKKNVYPIPKKKISIQDCKEIGGVNYRENVEKGGIERGREGKDLNREREEPFVLPQKHSDQLVV